VVVMAAAMAMTVASAVVTKVDLEANKNSVVVAEAAGVATKAVEEEVKIPGIKEVAAEAKVASAAILVGATMMQVEVAAAGVETLAGAAATTAKEEVTAVATREEASAVDNKAAMAVVTKVDTEEDVAAAKGEVAVVPVPCEAIQDLDTDPHHIR